MKFLDKKGFTHFDTRQGDGEQQTETYVQYVEGAAQPATQPGAKSTGKVIGTANVLGGAVRKPQENEKGLVAIVVVSVIIVILALMTMGFSRIMDRELRQSLDRGLSTQAYYAAESGLNDAREFVKKAIEEGKDPSTPAGECLNPASPPGGVSINPFVQRGSISGHFNNGDAPSSDNLIKYTCVLIDTAPEELVYPIEVGESKVFKVIPTNGAQISSLFFSWQNAEYPSTPGNPSLVCIQPIPGGGNNLPKESDFTSACQTGMLRTTIYPVPASIPAGNPNDTLAILARTYFLYSNGTGAKTTAASLSTRSYTQPTGAFVNGNCHRDNRQDTNYLPYRQATPRYCNAGITNLDTGAVDFFYVRLTALYKKISVSIQASDSSASNSPVQIGGAQAVIDVTAEGNDILRRLQARTPLEDSLPLPEYALQSMDTYCKHLRLPKTGPNTFGNTVIDDPNTDPRINGSGAGGVPAACQPQP